MIILNVNLTISYKSNIKGRDTIFKDNWLDYYKSLDNTHIFNSFISLKSNDSKIIKEVEDIILTQSTFQ